MEPIPPLSAALLLRTTLTDWGTGAIAAAATALFLYTRLHPLLVLGAAAALRATGFLTRRGALRRSADHD